MFPTDRPGASEPPPATSLTWGTARQLLDRAILHCPGWISCLKSVCALVELRGLTAILPSEDLHRVAEFARFWGEVVGDNPERPDYWHPVAVCARSLLRHLPNNAGKAGAAEGTGGGLAPPSGGDGAAEGSEGELSPPSGDGAGGFHRSESTIGNGGRQHEAVVTQASGPGSSSNVLKSVRDMGLGNGAGGSHRGDDVAAGPDTARHVLSVARARRRAPASWR